MSYRIGEAAKFFGVSTDTLRYYEKEGLLFPTTNEENGYREYSLDDIFILSDILFYRSTGTSIEDLRELITHSTAASMAELIASNKEKIAKKIAQYQTLLTKMDNWEHLHTEAMEYMGKYEVRSMPKLLHKQTFDNRESIPISVLKESVPVSADVAFFVTEAFTYDLKKKEPRYYFALDSQVSKGLDFDFGGSGFIEEEHNHCLFTVCEFQQDMEAMTKKIVNHAAENKIKLEGQIYGLMSISTYEKGEKTDYYRIYAPIKNI